MKIKFLQLPDNVQRVYDTRQGCRQALKNLANGRPSTPRNAFIWENKSDAYIPTVIVQMLESMQDLDEISKWDLGFMPKYGPQGKVAPLDFEHQIRFHNFEEYFVHLEMPRIINDPIFKAAIKQVIKDFKFNESGKPWTAEQVLEQGMNEDKYGTNSAFSEYLKKKSKKARRAAKDQYATAIEDKQPNTPGARATPGKTDEEARNIFMTAFAVVLAGQRFQKPLQEFITNLKIEFFAPWEGPDSVQRIASSFERHTWKLSADYDKMDQHFNKWHGKAVWEVCKHFYEKQYWAEFGEIIEYVFTQPILTNLGYIDQEHALVSGSEFTNFLETVWNYIFWTYMRLKYHIKCRHAMGIGDDQLLEFLQSEGWTDKQADKILDLIIREYDYAGTPGNKDKNLFSRDVFDFCQRRSTYKWNGHDGNVPWACVYRISRCAEMNQWPERYHNDKMVENGKRVAVYNKYTAAIQVIMRCENALQHPLFYKFLDFIWNGTPILKEFVSLKDSEISAQVKRSRKISTLNPTYNQEKADKPLFDFECFKYFRSKV